MSNKFINPETREAFGRFENHLRQKGFNVDVIVLYDDLLRKFFGVFPDLLPQHVCLGDVIQFIKHELDLNHKAFWIEKNELPILRKFYKFLGIKWPGRQITATSVALGLIPIVSIPPDKEFDDD